MSTDELPSMSTDELPSMSTDAANVTASFMFTGEGWNGGASEAEGVAHRLARRACRVP